MRYRQFQQVLIVASALLFCKYIISVVTNPSGIANQSAMEKQKLKCSLWLIPPSKSSEILRAQIVKFSADGKNGPIFEPHITVVSPIYIDSEDHGVALAKQLQEGLKGFGKIPCGPSREAYAFKDVWNQALIYTIELSAPFMNLCQKVRALLDMDTENWQFPAPAMYPHISLYYGVTNIPDKSTVDVVKSFQASTLSLVVTDPPTLEGVPQWKEIATISLL